MNEHTYITVLGLGNILLKDEGFGVHFVKWFSERHRFGEAVQILDGGTLGYRLLDIITSTSHLIVVDVIKVDDEPPGAIYRFTKEEMMLRMPEPTTAHEVEFPDVLFMAELAGESPEVTFLCIVPECYGTMELEMTPVMVEAFPKMERLLLQELAGYGIKADEVR